MQNRGNSELALMADDGFDGNLLKVINTPGPTLLEQVRTAALASKPLPSTAQSMSDIDYVQADVIGAKEIEIESGDKPMKINAKAIVGETVTVERTTANININVQLISSKQDMTLQGGQYQARAIVANGKLKIGGKKKPQPVLESQPVINPQPVQFVQAQPVQPVVQLVEVQQVQFAEDIVAAPPPFDEGLHNPKTPTASGLQQIQADLADLSLSDAPMTFAAIAPPVSAKVGQAASAPMASPVPLTSPAAVPSTLFAVPESQEQTVLARVVDELQIHLKELELKLPSHSVFKKVVITYAGLIPKVKPSPYLKDYLHLLIELCNNLRATKSTYENNLHKKLKDWFKKYKDNLMANNNLIDLQIQNNNPCVTFKSTASPVQRLET